jgi:hypothetical protein
VLGAAGLGVSLFGITVQLLPRHFTAAQQQQIMAWEVGRRWREFPAGTIFAATVRYPPPASLHAGDSSSLTASRVGIARQASCEAATDPAVAAVLARHGCAALLRATYVDATDTYVVTVGVAALRDAAQASAVRRELSRAGDSGGVHTVRFANTQAAAFTNGRRQISASVSSGPYVVLYTIGYADSRPRVPVTADRYADSEMTGMGTGVADSVATVLGAPPSPPRCPGAPGC